jgi:hypothetical protein
VPQAPFRTFQVTTRLIGKICVAAPVPTPRAV